MYNLLRTDFYYLIKSKLFWLSLVAVALFTAIMEIDNLGFLSEEFKDDDYFFTSITGNVLPVVFFAAAIIPFVAGSNFDGGMIRNKIQAGHSRTSIFFSSYIVSTVAGLAIHASSLIANVLVIGFDFGWDKVMAWTKIDGFINFVVVTIIIFIFTTLCYAAISTSFVMNFGNKIVGMVAIVVIFFVFFGCYVVRFFAVDNREYIESYNYETQKVEQSPNPYYIPQDSPKKKFYVAFDSINFAVQSIDSPIFYVEESDDVNVFMIRYYVGDAIMLATILGIGLVKFKKCDLK